MCTVQIERSAGVCVEFSLFFPFWLHKNTDVNTAIVI